MNYEYEIINLDKNGLPEADMVVRGVESAFAPEYDELQFTTPGMRLMAETDEALLQRWLNKPEGKRVLEIGPGTGRITLPMAETVGEAGKIYAIETARPYLDRLTYKARVFGLNPSRLKLGVGDIQQLTTDDLYQFVDGRAIDDVVIWFGPLALMTTNPQRVLDSCAQILKQNGSLMLTTNSLNGLSYRVPEAAIRNGADPENPLGYEPSIRTRRSFSDPDSYRPDGMILADGQVLPARFYGPDDLKEMVEKAGLRVLEAKGITRLTGLYPAKPNAENVRIFTNLISDIEPEAAERMQGCKSPEDVWKVAAEYDDKFCQNTGRLYQYTYPAFRAVKPFTAFQIRGH